MKPTKRIAAFVAAATAGAAVSTAAAPQPQSPSQNPWARCCGLEPWPLGGQMTGTARGGTMPPQSSGTVRPQSGGMVRNRFSTTGDVPAPYTNLSNPLPRTRATVDRGAKVYAANCVSCHGETGLGDGPAGRALSPPPAGLGWLTRIPVSNLDPFMYWTVAEGGAWTASGMHAFKKTLSKEDTWAAIAYIQARLPPR